KQFRSKTDLSAVELWTGAYYSTFHKGHVRKRRKQTRREQIVRPEITGRRHCPLWKGVDDDGRPRRAAGGRALSRPEDRAGRARAGTSEGAGRPEGTADESRSDPGNNPRSPAAGICPRLPGAAGERASDGMALCAAAYENGAGSFLGKPVQKL